MEWLLLLAAGLAAGVLSGLLGVGGGIVMVPVLHYLVGFTWPEAVALSLLVIAVQSPLGLWRHHIRGAVDLRMGILLATSGLAGVALGTWLEPRIGVPWLKLLFAALMVFAAYRLAGPWRPPPENHKVAPAALLLLGFAAGVVSRLLGVGGGILTVPVMALMGIPAHLAIGTSLLPVFSNAAFASSWNLAHGLQWLTGVWLAVGALIGAPFGVRIAHALPEQGLRRVVAVALVLVAGLVALDVLW